MGEMKAGKEFDDLLEESPKVFTEYFSHSRKLECKEQPDYPLIYRTLDEGFRDNGLVDDSMFDWLEEDKLPGGTLIPSHKFDIELAANGHL